MRLIGCVIIFLLALPALAQERPKNHLANETSLYLLQHAENPVDWYPWGDVALEKAKREDKLLFISVGYAACHWCHVMEEESFENEAIAKLLNDNFVSIKIDRERRPDLDEQFSLVTTMLTGGSGWPTSVFMTPDGEPFYAGTYYPPDAFTKVINTITKVWAADRPSLTAEANAIANEMRAYLDQTAVLGEVSADELLKTARQLIGDLDEFYGGFGEAPKFPRELMLLFLLDQATRSGDTELLNAVTATIDGMIRGGISDQLAGGFHRYAIDPEWHVPHFEKMLYNQALIGRVMLRAYGATGNPEYARTAIRTFDYVLRDMTGETGAFYSAEDADSLNRAGELLEGIFYVWTPEEITEALGAEAAEIIALFDVQDEGIFEGKNVLYLQDLPLPAIKDAGLTLEQFDARLERLRLFRAKRSQPIKDKKIILSWNSEMIASLAEAARVLNRPDYYTAAEKAADFLLANLWPDSGLKRIWREGRADVPAQLVDYGAFGSALMALYDYSTDSGTGWLTPAQRLADTMVAQFADPGKAMRMTTQTAGLGPFRPLDDTEIASGNAQALALLDGLDRRQARVGDLAPRLAGALAIDALNIPDQRAAILNALAVHDGGPATALRLSNGGAVRVLASANRQSGKLSLALRLGKGWHINAHEPLEDYLIGMALSVENTPVDVASYPAAEIKELGFSKTPLALYEQNFTLEVPFTMPQSGPAKAVLTLQACNDEVCLPPDDMIFWIW